MTWTAPTAERAKPPVVAGEREMYQGWLDFHRQTLLTKCAGLTAEQLKLRSTEPSTLTLLGLVRHMTEVERGWFRISAAEQKLEYVYCTESNPDGDFDDVAEADAERDLAAFLDEIRLCDEAVAQLPIEHTFRHPRRGTEMGLRWVYLHMIEEYARHNGHADLLRERIDGATGD